MATPEESRIYRLSMVCGLVVAASFIVPRFVTNPEGGFAAGANAVMTLLAMLAAASVFSLYLLAVTVRSYREISFGARAAGIAPSVILALALLWLALLLVY